MRFTFENQGTNTYLVYEIGENDELDSMSLGMLTNNTIPGFAATTFTQMDATKYIKYNVSAKVSVAQLFEGAVNKKRLIGVFSGIVDAMLAAEDYMLDTNSLLLDLDYIFADVSTCETVVVCLPVMNLERRNPDLGAFFKNIIFNTQFDQTENCDHVAQILNYLNSSTSLSLTDFKELLDAIQKKGEPVRMVQPKPVPSEPARIIPNAAGAQQPVVPQPAAPATLGNTSSAPQVNTPPAKPKHENLQFGPNYHSSGNAPADGATGRTTPPPTPPAKEEKPMTMFYLLQHYNKENAALYKAQQEAKKAKKNGTPPPAPQPARPAAQPKQPNVGFAIPGKQEPVTPSFAVPGQQPKVPTGQPTVQDLPPTQPVPRTYQQPLMDTQSLNAAYQQSAAPARPINFGETTVLSGAMGETTVLGVSAEQNQIMPHLIRVKNNERIPLNKPVFRIGKERSYVDYFVSDNTAISRSHANIVNHNGEFFVVDTNSTNHTYVNGSMIPSNVETKLNHGTTIRLANEDFEFKLY